MFSSRRNVISSHTPSSPSGRKFSTKSLVRNKSNFDIVVVVVVVVVVSTVVIHACTYTRTHAQTIVIGCVRLLASTPFTIMTRSQSCIETENAACHWHVFSFSGLGYYYLFVFCKRIPFVFSPYLSEFFFFFFVFLCSRFFVRLDNIKHGALKRTTVLSYTLYTYIGRYKLQI